MTFLGYKENFEDLYWGIRTWEASVGEMIPKIFDLLGNKSVGECLLGWGNQEFGCIPIYWGIILVGDKPRS